MDFIPAPRTLAERVAIAKRQPHRITITVPDSTFQRLLTKSDLEGRSLSNLAAFLLETNLANHT
jgi:hypothetical protein